MSTISSPGIGSGIDVQTIVSQLVALEKAPLAQLEKQASSIQTKLSTYGSIKSQVSALGDAAAKLAGSSGWNAGKLVAIGAVSSTSTPARASPGRRSHLSLPGRRPLLVRHAAHGHHAGRGSRRGLDRMPSGRADQVQG